MFQLQLSVIRFDSSTAIPLFHAKRTVSYLLPVVGSRQLLYSARRISSSNGAFERCG
jgi:hypothetical protein